MNNKQDYAKVIQVLDKMEEIMPYKVIRMDPRLMFDLASIYYGAGGMKQYTKLALEIEKYAWAKMETDPTDVQSYYNPYRMLLDTYENLGQFNKALEVVNRLKVYFPNDPTINDMIQKYTAMSKNPKTDNPSLPGIDTTKK